MSDRPPMTAHLPGCPAEGSAVPADTCVPCGWIRLGMALGRSVTVEDQTNEAGR